ncbi:LysR family transcriptional regulator [Pseudonocardia kunmingensis]|uniref:DNA-binding transcriptional LysR family regulator n=1 Tax=Pseudonocardia kunmingensis TaxID=630975 RepID=A0A543DR60_9PSEU|nr:LysR substrate-binding domain-containing protein [Pseudonocardia kunmingensis]TQM11811.1 DNA-binding transcriptional LysR family regulator [Pseudonocardia kunmingensis]
METRYLRSFLAIAEELHFGRAARRLHLAQPSLSQHLQRLERDVGVALVRRSSHEVRLTPAGELFRDEARKLLDHMDRAVAAAHAVATGRAGTLTIGFNFPAGQDVLPAALVHLGAQHPRVQTQLWERRTGPQLEGVLGGELDVAFVYGSPTSPRLSSKELMTVPIVAVVGEHHPWAGRDDLPMRMLERQPCLLFRREQSPAMHDAIVGAAGRAGIKLTIAGEVDDPVATGVLVSARQVIGFSSASRASRGPAQGLVAVPLTAPAPTLALHVVWRAEDRTPLVDALLAALEAAGPFSVPSPRPA